MGDRELIERARMRSKSIREIGDESTSDMLTALAARLEALRLQAGDREAMARVRRVIAYWEAAAPSVVDDGAPINTEDFGEPYNNSEAITWADLRGLLALAPGEGE